MISAWDNLIEHSGAPLGSTAWIHLTLQKGDLGGVGFPFPVENLTIDISEDVLLAAITTDILEVEIYKDELTLEVQDDNFTIGVEND